MALEDKNAFYRDYYHYFFYGLTLLALIVVFMGGVVMYMLKNRPKPAYAAKNPAGKTMSLTGTNEPNLMPDTIIRFASKAAVLAYTYDFSRYDAQLAEARPYFTRGGWDAFNAKLSGQIKTVVANRLFVNGVVVGTPVISNQGELPERGYVWRVEIPFLITFQSSSRTSKQNATIVVGVVRVPTSDNPQGIGIDQFITA